jgi:hypothetical protein
MARPPGLTLVCVGCLKEPHEIPAYTAMLVGEDGEALYPDEATFVWEEEGTLNTTNGHFLCDDCYIAWGQPSKPVAEGGWKAP